MRYLIIALVVISVVSSVFYASLRDDRSDLLIEKQPINISPNTVNITLQEIKREPPISQASEDKSNLLAKQQINISPNIPKNKKDKNGSDNGSDNDKRYSSELDTLLSNKDIKSRKDFIKEKNKSLNLDSFREVLNEYRNNPDIRSERRIISSAILSEIQDDILIDAFYQEVTYDESLLADFVSATYYTRSQNSFNKLMDLQGLNYNQQVMEDLKKGTLMMYQGNVTKEVVSHIDTWLANRSHMNKQQEDIIVGLLLQSSSDNIKKVVNGNIFKFSSIGQEAIESYLGGIPTRELRYSPLSRQENGLYLVGYAACPSFNLSL